MRTIAIIQARMGSTRLRGKVLIDLNGESVLGRVMLRVARSKILDNAIVATSDCPADDAVAELCVRRDWPCFRGSEDDVLDRYYRAALSFSAQTIVRITSDCPLIDPEVIDLVIDAYQNQAVDYASNCLERTYPRGLDTEVLSIKALRRAWEEAPLSHEREHVTPYIYQHPEFFRLTSVKNREDYHQHRWTLDTPEDLQLIRTIYERLGNRDDFGWREALALMEREPELAAINAHVMQKSSSPQV